MGLEGAKSVSGHKKTFGWVPESRQKRLFAATAVLELFR